MAGIGVYLTKRGAAGLDRLAKLQRQIFRSAAGTSPATSLSRPLKQLTGSRVTRKSL